MKVISKIAIVFAAGLLASAGLSNVYAICALPGTTFTTNYFDAPIGQDTAATTGVFWGVGQFNPASPGGHDSGTYPSSDWLRYTPGLGFYLAGDWAGDPRIDGCIQDSPNPQPAKMAVAFSTTDGTDAYFVALCSTEDAGGSFGTLTDIPGAQMTQIPKPRITASSRSGNDTNLTVGIEALTDGVYNTGGCTLAVTGFKIYQQTVPRGAPAPTSRTPGGPWVALGTSNSPAGSVAGVVNCATNSDVYLLGTLVFDGTVELKNGSRNSTKVECGPNIATPEGDDNFRLIRKPKNAKGR